MIQAIKNIIRNSFFYEIINSIRQKKLLRDWENKGKPIPPPHLVKQRIVKEYAKKFSINILIETGTYLGDMIYATRNTFRKIISIELDKALYERTKRKFSKFAHISIIQGDSGEVLSGLLANIKQRCLFWLDGHYSGGITGKGKINTPIMQELYHILDHYIEDHIILIDDTRRFTGENDYPTIKELRDLIFKRHPSWVFEVKDDIIRIHKKHST